jgi:hypothetical protein
MKNRIESAITKGRISKEIRDKYKGFSEWNVEVTKQNHQSIVQVNIKYILSDLGRQNPDSEDNKKKNI